MSLQQNPAAVTAARAHVKAWSDRDFDAAREALADDVWVTAISTDRNRPQTDRHGVDEYMVGLVEYAQAIVVEQEPARADRDEVVVDQLAQLLAVVMKLRLVELVLQFLDGVVHHVSFRSVVSGKARTA